MNIVVTDGYTLNPGDLDWAPLRQLGNCVIYERSTPQQTIDRCREAHIIVTNKTVIDRAVLQAAPHLQLICVTATGYNNVDTTAAREQGIAVCNVPEYGTAAVAQHVLAMMLHFTNHIALHAQAVQNGEWTSGADWSLTKAAVTELSGKTLGIVGMGRIGRQVAKLAAAFDMQIIYTSRTPKEDVAGKWVSLEQLFTISDFVSLHCPLTADNRGMVNDAVLSLMKPTAVLINTARGPLIDEPALREALMKGTPAAALLDVLSTEPPPAGHPLLGLPNCIITPHIAWMATEARRRLLQTTADNIAAAKKGQPQHVVN